MGIIAEPTRTLPFSESLAAASLGDRADRRAVRPVVDSKRKRLVDVVLSLFGVVVLAPVLPAIAVAVILDSGWPALYSQRRVGLDGRPFTLWKFRTMVRDADTRRDELSAMNESVFPAFKMRRDPRTTRIGSILRRTSLDELPQLWNVLRGDMSLVGPRPPLPEEVRHYGEFAMRRLGARPGITCLWQIENRRCGQDLRFEDWVRKDLAYIEHWDMRLDFLLLLKTVRVVASFTGH